MQKQDFYFDLPEELIAQYPLDNRTDSRLLVYNRQQSQHTHSYFRDLPDWLDEGDLLVLNNTKVIPARFFGVKASGGKIEFLLERLNSDNTFLTHIRASKAPKPGSIIFLTPNREKIVVLEKQHDLYLCESENALEPILQKIGHIPLPCYINRQDEHLDNHRYQTVYAEHKGSVAAPTAGLHFDETLLKALKDKGVNVAYVTLHVGAGTFKPVRVDNILEHKMHSEQCLVDDDLCAQVARTRQKNKRVIAVGTTALRSLETAAASGVIKPYQGETDIFIYPGYQFNVCDGLITNFHLPESTLLMLVSAFIGHNAAMGLYQEAIANHYRFFSYGDASFLF